MVIPIIRTILGSILGSPYFGKLRYTQHEGPLMLQILQRRRPFKATGSEGKKKFRTQVLRVLREKNLDLDQSFPLGPGRHQSR